MDLRGSLQVYEIRK